MLQWNELLNECNNCSNCDLASTRTNVVIGRGNVNAKVMFIGEGPGEQEDVHGLPFVGPAGKLLDILFEAIGLEEDDYYIANIVKCRPPSNRVPTDSEAEQCLPLLRNQFALIRPQIIVCLGNTAARHIIGKEQKITQIRGQWIERKGVYMMPTFHPAALLRDQSKKELLFKDIKAVKQKLDDIKNVSYSRI